MSDSLRMTECIKFEILLTTIFNEYYQQLQIIAQKYVHHKEDAKDIVGDIFLYFWLHRNKYECYDTESLIKIIKISTKKRSIKYYNKNCIMNQNIASSELLETAYCDLNLDDTIHNINICKNALKLLQKKHSLYLEVVILRYYHDMSFQNIAKILGITYESARKKCSRALFLIRSELEKNPQI